MAVTKLEVPLKNGRVATIEIDPLTGTADVTGATIVLHHMPFRIVDEKVTQIEVDDSLISASELKEDGSGITVTIMRGNGPWWEEDAPLIAARIMTEPSKKEDDLEPGIYAGVQLPGERGFELVGPHSLATHEEDDEE
ncbi:MAG: hypothetical protein O2794_04135 [bacterium]|nr:hypothetical protein [bacterium]